MTFDKTQYTFIVELMTNVYTVFSDAKHTIASHFQNNAAQQRLQTVRYELVDAATMAQHLYGDNYRSSVRVPGYYDPNSHTIFLNKKTLPQTAPETAYIICYHELVHSLSAHHEIKTTEYQAFQSGIKIEVFSKRGYRCYHRALNEGMVQFLTTQNAHVPSDKYAYAKEVGIIEKIADTLGRAIIHHTITTGDWRIFKKKLDDYYGAQTFQKLSAHMDKKQYTQAHMLLVEN